MKTYTPTLTISIKDPKIHEIMKLVSDNGMDYSMCGSLKIKVPPNHNKTADQIMTLAKDWKLK